MKERRTTASGGSTKSGGLSPLNLTSARRNRSGCSSDPEEKSVVPGVAPPDVEGAGRRLLSCSKKYQNHQNDFGRKYQNNQNDFSTKYQNSQNGFS
jgi:hypothetical protein